MALAKELIELHGGRIFLESSLGKGSRFWFRIPVEAVETESIIQRSNVPESNRTSPSVSDHFQRFADLMVCDFDRSLHKPMDEPVSNDAPTVLVVDDTPEVRSMVGELLADRYQVIFAADGAQGLDVVKQKLPDLIIADVMMPYIDGYEFCRRTKEDPVTAGIPFVMLTAKADLSMKIAGLECGADDYLVKPFDKEELRARVRSLLKLRHLHREIDERNTELKTTLEELRQTQSQLIHSEKMSSLGQLVAGIAHEINNAINAVYNGIQPLRKKSQRLQSLVSELIDKAEIETNSQTFDEIQQNLRKISQLAEIVEHGASRTARIVKDLKTFSHPGSEAGETFNLHESIDICLHLMASQMKHRIEVRKEYHGDGMITAPSGELNQVIMNLMSNALQAIPDKGEIVISTSNTGEQTLIRIRDNGIGIPQDVRSNIFDPFFTTKEPGVGTGLGLSISYGIINRLGGRIECHSDPGDGTEFLITLPNHTEPDQTGDDVACLVTADSPEGVNTL
jgi:two-component system NtrC family sensor kinase